MFKMLVKKLKVLLEDISAEDTPSKDIDKQTKALQDVKLYTESGVLIENYSGVYLSHWDTNIYHLYTKEGGDFITRIDKGANMMLISHDISSNKVT